MSNIKIEVSAGDDAALRYFGEAMIKLSSYLRDESPVDIRVEPVTIKVDMSAATEELQKVKPYTPKWLTEPVLFKPENYVHMYQPEEDIYRLAKSPAEVEVCMAEGYERHTQEQYDVWNPATHVITEGVKVGGPVSLGDGNFSQGYRIEVNALVVDSTGTPWDERIHASSKALNSDGTWRTRRKPKDMDDTEWVALVESVKAELDRLCKDEGCEHHGTPHECVSVKTGVESLDIQQEIDNGPEVTPTGDDFHTDAEVVTEQQVAAIPPVAPPAIVPPPVTTDIATFPQLMKFLTERNGKITVADVQSLCTSQGLENVQQLNAQPELIPAFVAAAKNLIGE